jgi:NADP-dependent 3-hydroxy acid dehydrogenase YdfG
MAASECRGSDEAAFQSRRPRGRYPEADVTLANQTALITGAGSGIGKAIAISLAEAGVRIALVGRNRATLEATKAALGDAGDVAVVAPCDVTERAQVEAAVHDILAEFGQIDILVCNAGINVTKRSLRSLEPGDWDRLIATNLTGAFNLVHFVLPSMRERGNGLIVQIASVSAMTANTVSGVAYSASKSGQAVLGLAIAREERGRGIRSTVIYPGEVNTAFLDSRMSRPGGVEGTRRETILQPSDIAAAVRFIAELPPRVHVPELVIKPTLDDLP